MKIKVTEEQLKRLREDESVAPLSKFEIKMLEMLHKKELESTGVREFMDKLGFDMEESLEIALLYDLNGRPEDGYASIETPIREADLDDYPDEQAALYSFLMDEGNDELINIIQLEEESYDHYGMKLYGLKGRTIKHSDGSRASYDEWAVGTDEEADEGFDMYAQDVVDDWGSWFEAADLLNYGVVEFDDYFMEDEVRNYIDNMSSEEILEEADMSDEYDEEEEEWLEKIELASADEVDQVKEMMEKRLNTISAMAYDEVRDSFTEMWKDEFNDDPVAWFYDHWGLDSYQIINDYGDLDDDALREHIKNGWSRGDAISSYDGYEHEFEYNGEWYYIYQVN